MASNIGSTNGTYFNRINMKPLPDEEIVSLWGQNICDNLAMLAWQKPTLFNINGIGADNDETHDGQYSGTAQFFIPYGRGTVFGTFAIYTDSTPGGDNGTLLIDDDVIYIFSSQGAGTLLTKGYRWVPPASGTNALHYAIAKINTFNIAQSDPMQQTVVRQWDGLLENWCEG